MDWNRHSELIGQHAFLSPSSYHWLNYDDDKLDLRFKSHMNARRGTDLHALASEAIRLKVNLPDTQNTLNMYVNDAIGFGMDPEVPLFYSANCFGTADAMKFSPQTLTLRIHDLKTGLIYTKTTQLKVYAGLFCLEYGFKPSELTLIQVRIYQSNEIITEDCDPAEIQSIMDTIIHHDKYIRTLREEAGL